MRTPAPPYATASGWIGPSEGLGNPPPPPLTCPPPPLTCPPPPLTCPPPPLTCPQPPLTRPPTPPTPFITGYSPFGSTTPPSPNSQAVRTRAVKHFRIRPT